MLKKKKNPLRKVLMVIGILFGILLIYSYVHPLIRQAMVSDTPVVAIEGTCEKVFRTMDNSVKPEDISVYAVHEDETTHQLSPKEYEIVYDDIPKVGGAFSIPVRFTADDSISCYIEASIKREKITDFACGFPNINDVHAVLYDNGELCFEGSGEMMVFNKGEQPWLEYDTDTDTPVRAVSFEKGVTPTNLNYICKGLDSLEYVDKLPDSVITMVGAFADCPLLSSTADWSGCTNLINAESGYSNNMSLVYIHPFPNSLRTAKLAFSDCTSLAYMPDMNNATNLYDVSGMFKNCTSITEAAIPPCATDISNMFNNCINLKAVPKIPETVTNMNSTFYNNVSLVSGNDIPGNVEDLRECFYGCELLRGKMNVYCDTEEYGNCFDGACVATYLTINGPSESLWLYAGTCLSGHVTVNKMEIDKIDDVNQSIIDGQSNTSDANKKG